MSRALSHRLVWAGGRVEPHDGLLSTTEVHDARRDGQVDRRHGSDLRRARPPRARRARRHRVGMQVFTLPPDWDGYPNHDHGSEAFDPNQEEVYIPLSGAATLVADGSEFELRPGTMVRVGPDQLRQILPGPDGIRFVAIGGSPGAFAPGAWTELGADPPNPPAE